MCGEGRAALGTILDPGSRVHVVSNPYLLEILTKLRSVDTPCHVFRQLLEEAGYLLGVEASKSMGARSVKVKTPLGVEADGIVVDRSGLVVLAVVRAAIPMAMGFIRAHPTAMLGFAVARRVEEGERVYAVLDYFKAPCGRVLVVVDPMIATGSTISLVLRRYVEECGRPEKTIVVGIIGTMYGVQKILEVDPRTEFYLLAVDPKLNDKWFIVPGLGDAGDRACCTT